MSKIRVPIWQQPNKYAVLDTADRLPATIGVNVFLPDGSLFNPATVAPVTQQPSGPPAVGGVTVTVWSAIQDVPQAVRKVEAIAGTGVLTRNAGGDLRGKALTAGANVTIVEDANSITLSSTGFIHTQGSAATSWTVNHNLGFRPAVEVFSVGGAEIDAEVLHTSVNQTVISFNTATAGSARFT